LSKNLDQLDASKAGVSQAELEESFLSIATLEEELVVEEAALETALAAKAKSRVTLDKAIAKVRKAILSRDPVFEELQRASWIVRNADPDQPVPPLGKQAPTIRAKRVTS